MCVTLAAGLVLRLPHIQCKTASASDIVDTDRAFLEVEMLAAMAGIAREIESYNSAYQLAWEPSGKILLGAFMNPSGARSMRGQPKLFHCFRGAQGY